MPFFSVSWRIENFSMCAHKMNERLRSPMFELPELGKVKWSLLLYPKGEEASNSMHVACYIVRKDSDQSSKISLFNIKLSVVSFPSNAPNVVFEDRDFIIDRNSSFGYPKLISHERLFNPANGFLPNDTLTIHLYIRPVLDDENMLDAPDTKILFSNPLHPNYIVEKSFSMDSEKEDLPLSHCSFLTRIPVEKKTLNWTMKEFRAKTKSREEMSVVLDSEFQEGVKLQLVCYVTGSSKENESLKMDIFRKGTDLRFSFVKCKVSFLDGSDSAKSTKKSDHEFDETYRKWSISLIDKLDSLENFLNDDSLKIKCDFVISYASQHVDFFVGKSSNQNKLQGNILKMLDCQDTSDASFECEKGKKYPVHKFLMMAHSPVFRAMFSSDTLEKQTGVIRMQDTDTDTVRHLRDYLYSDSLPDLEAESMLRLFSVADKYQIENLKERCSTFLKCNMDLGNVCEILTKADMHQDSGLKDYAVDYVISEMDFDSDLWKAFMDENLPLAAEAMRQFCMRKRDSNI